jgi:hypothetical protein
MDQFSHLVQDSIDILRDYHTALEARDTAKIEALRGAIEGADQFRQQAKEQLLAHQASHRTESATADPGSSSSTLIFK